MPSQASWTIDNLPDIIYQWKPTAANITTGGVDFKPYPIFGKLLKDFDVLPDRISSNVEPWLLQAWFRLDSRIRWEDITDRIEPSARPKWNTLNMDCVRQREDFFMRPWGTSKGVSTRKRDAVFESVLRNAGIDPASNATRGLTPGLVDPSAGPDSERVPVPERWMKSRKQRKAEGDVVVAVKDTRARPSLRISSCKSDAKKPKAVKSKEVAELHGGDITVPPATAKFESGGIRSLKAQRVRNGQAQPLNKVEGADGRRSHKRKARTTDDVEGDEYRTPKRRDMGTAKWEQLPEETLRKRKAQRSEETEQQDEERPCKMRNLQSQPAKLKVEEQADGLDSSFYSDGWSATDLTHYNLYNQTVPPASPMPKKQHTTSSSRLPTFCEAMQTNNTLDPRPTGAYIGYLQSAAAELEAEGVLVRGMRRDPLNKVGRHNTHRHASIIQSPALGPLDFRTHADTETEHSADLSLPSAVMTPCDLGEDMLASSHSTQPDLFGDCVVDEFEEYLQRPFYGTSS